MSEINFFSLSEVKQQVEKKVEKNMEIKEKLRNAVREVNTIDDISKLLDYKVKLSQKDWASSIERLYKIQYESWGMQYNPLEKKRGRQSIFTKDKNDIVSKFRKSGIIKYRTVTHNTVTTGTGNKRQSKLWDEINKKWKENMLDWIDKADDRLSNDEKSINDIKFQYLNDNIESDFSDQILKNLNDDNDFNIIKYENGEIDAAVHDIIVVDLTE